MYKNIFVAALLFAVLSAAPVLAVTKTTAELTINPGTVTYALLATDVEAHFMAHADFTSEIAAYALTSSVYTKTNMQTTGEALVNWANVTNKPTIGIGDMLASLYATGEAGVVNNANELGGQMAAYYRARANHTGTQLHTTISDWSAEVASNWTVADKLSVSGTAADSDKLDTQHGSYYLARANHTGTQNSATIANFTSEVQAVSLLGLHKTVEVFVAPGDSAVFTLTNTPLIVPRVNFAGAAEQIAYRDFTVSGKDVTFVGGNPTAGAYIYIENTY